MSYYGGTEAAAAYQAMANASKASGAIVNMKPADFKKILDKIEQPLVVTAKAGFWGNKFSYLTSYRGLFFYTSSSEKLMLPSKAEIVAANKIWIPG